MITASQPVPKANYVVPATPTTATAQVKCNSNHATVSNLLMFL
jgi:hypothetical protein